MQGSDTIQKRLANELVDARRRIVELEEEIALLEVSNFSKTADYLRFLVSSIPDLVWLKDPNGVYLSCNPTFERFFGAHEEEIVGKTDYDFVSKDLADFFLEHDRKAMAAGKPSINEEWLTFSSDGYRGLFETVKTPMFDGQGKLIGVLGIARDITDRKRAEQVLEKRMTALTKPLGDSQGIDFENLFNLEDIQRLQDEFAHATGVASLITRPDGQPITRLSNVKPLGVDIIRKCQKGLLDCLRTDASVGRLKANGPTIRASLETGLYEAGAGISIDGRHIANWLIAQVRDESMTDEHMRNYARELGFEEEATLAAFQEVPALSKHQFKKVATVLHTLANQLSSIAYQNIQQARFISERKKVEEELVEMKNRAEAASRVKTEFLANMSHEIRTPLNGALGMLRLLEATPLSRQQQEYLGAVTSSTRRLTRLLTDILDISRIEAGKMTIEKADFRISSLEESILGSFSQSALVKGLDLKIHIEQDIPPTLNGDEARLRQIICNLVGNAIKFTDKGFVRVRVIKLSEGRDGLVRLLFMVEDTGIGLSDGLLLEIFKPFVQAEANYTRRFQGAGLGLAIVRRLVQLMGGELAIDNGGEKGTSVYVSLPFFLSASGQITRTNESNGQKDIKLANLRVLLVEDEPISAMAGKILLEKAGHHVVTAANGQEAITCLSGADFDLILMDVQMPEMDGVEATRKIRAATSLGARREIPIIAMTAYSMIGDREKFLEAGMDGYIAKPVSYNDIVAAILKVLPKIDQL